MDQECLFCKIAEGEIPTEFLYEDDVCVAFNDMHPQAPTHILLIPKKHVASLEESASEDKDLLGHLMLATASIAREMGFSKKGYRTVINTNEDGGQTVFHLHVHLLGGRKFIFPPG